MASADGSIVISVDADDKEAQKKLNSLTKKIEALEKKITSKTADRNQLVEQLRAANDEAIETYNTVERLQKELAESKARTSVYGPSIDPTQYAQELERQKEISAEIKEQEDLLKKKEAVAEKLNEKDSKMVADLERQNDELNQLKEQAGEVHRQMEAASESTLRMPEAINSANVYMNKFVNRVAGLAKRVFVFTLITKALRAMRSWMWKAIQTSDEAKNAIAQLKGALLTLAQPIIQVIIPAFTMLIQIITRVVQVIANLVSALFGTTASQSAKSAKSLYEEMNAVEGVGDAAEEASQQLAGFDEINTISTEDSTSGGAAGAADSGITPDFGAFDLEKYKQKIDELTVYISGALLALGAILLFSGANIPLGLGLMVLGALGLAAEIKENWGAMDGPIGEAINRTLLILGGALLVLGAILTFSGANIPLGIGLMIVGAASLATAVAINWDAIVQALQGPMGVLFGALCAALLVIGAILTFSGVNIPLGIALMVVGAAGLATVVAVNWDTISKALQGPIGVITALVSAALLVLGAIILFSGTNIPLGLGLMIAGAVGLAATVAANWNTVQELLQGPLGIVAGLVSAAVLVLGAIFTFSGTHIPLGIALMAVGAAGLVTVLAVNWETMKGILQGPIGVLTGIISAALLVLGAILVFSGVGIPLGIGLMAAGAIGLATAIAANWDFLTDMLGGKLNTILTIIYAATLVLGIILLCTGAGIPLGLGLIIASAAGLVQTITPHWDYILEKLQGIWKSISDWWNNTVAPKLKALKNFFVDNIINPVLGFFEGFINKIIDGLNWLIRMINKISFDVPDWVPGIGGKKLGFNIPTVSYVSIPRLAQGAVIPPNREFAAVLGDQTNGNNLEAPEDLIRQIVREESGSSEMVSLLQAILEATKAGHVMKVDKKVLARTAADGINDITLSSGKPALVF